MSSSRPIRVFISYSHDSKDHAGKVLKLAGQLRRDGIDAWIDQYEPAPAQGWPLWMEQQVERADFVLCVCTETYRRRFDQQEDPGRGLGVVWEGGLLRTRLYLDRGENKKVFPLLFAAQDLAHIPSPLVATPRFEPLSQEGYKALYRLLTKQPESPPPPLGAPKVLPSLHRQSLFGKALTSITLKSTALDDPAGDPANNHTENSGSSLSPYLNWAKSHYDHLNLIGIDAGDVQVRLDDVYVPLRVAHRGTMDAKDRCLAPGIWHSLETSAAGMERDGGQENLELDEILRRGDPPHVLIFGEPGSGKTTALLKLHRMCWKPTELGLPADTVPVFLRLRHLSKPLLDQGLAAFLDHEIREVTGGRLTGFGERLWHHGKLLLLFDGLDEIADEEHRTEVLRHIGWTLEQESAKGLRAVVSCRRVGLPGSGADRACRFQTFEVRPLQNQQIKDLVELWFREMARLDRISQIVADQRAETILQALENRQAGNQQILAMVSNPLLLTLLCVVVLLGNEIPKKRVRFYQQCLDVLLDRWPQFRDRKSPVELSDSRAAVARLAFFLHSRTRRDNLRWSQAVVELKDHFGDRDLAERFFDWLHEEAGLLVDCGAEKFGFVHLGIQEHLAACHLVANPEGLEILTGSFDESWWTEVFLQLSALSEQKGFDHLMARLLHHTDALEQQAGLLRECLRETSRPELAAFAKVLEAGNSVRQEAVLRLLWGQEILSPELLKIVERLAAKTEPDTKPDTKPDAEPKVRKAAKQLLLSRRQGQGRTEFLGLVYDHVADQAPADDLASRLTNWQGGWPVQVIRGTGRKSGKAMAGCKALVVLVGSDLGGFEGGDSLRRLYDKTTWLVVRLPGEPRGVVPADFADCDVVDWQLGAEEELMRAIVARLPQEATTTEPAPRVGSGSPSLIDQRFIEAATGEVFLPVPGGSFLMGSDGLFSAEEQKGLAEEYVQAPAPAHRVRLSPFWLAQGPVTNRQYGLFFQASKHREPENWRDRRFSNPEQPVVGVSWEDAVAYCKWLTENDKDGRSFQLPSEAQWEFAARGPESRTYPWGKEAPSDLLACHGLDYQEDKPAAVGAYPGGAGPFAHLDQAGLVWEWCRDPWEKDYSRWVGGEPLDPVGEGDPDLRPLRGGCWWFPALFLRSATRSGFRPRDRDVLVGFRVLCAPSSLSS